MGYSIEFYKWQITCLYARIDNLRAEIRNYTNLYESLRTFKRAVEASQQNFNNINGSKKEILNDIASVKANNRAAAKYYSGISNILDGTGTKIISAAYRGLIQQITNKLWEYRNAIYNCNRQIALYDRDITGLKMKIAEIRRQELEESRYE